MLPIIVSLFVLAGWYFDIEVLKRVSPGFVAMNPMTACLFLLAGLSLACRSSAGHRALFTGCEELARYSSWRSRSQSSWNSRSGWAIGVDHWPFATRLDGGKGVLPNRMAPNTAACFALIALSMLSLDFQVKRFSFSQAFALLAGVGALLSDPWIRLRGEIF